MKKGIVQALALAAVCVLGSVNLATACGSCTMTNTHVKYTGNGACNGDFVFSATVDYDVTTTGSGHWDSAGCTAQVTGGLNVACGGGNPPPAGSNLEYIAAWNSKQPSGSNNGWTVTSRITCFFTLYDSKTGSATVSDTVGASYLCN